MNVTVFDPTQQILPRTQGNVSARRATSEMSGRIRGQLLANGMLQQLVQPFAMGAALGIHPLAVLIVTIGGLAAP